MGSNKRKRNRKKGVTAHNKIKIVVIILVVLLALGLTAAGVGYAVVRTYIDELGEIDLNMLDPTTTSYLYDKDERQFADIYSDQNRIKVPLETVPQHVQNAFIAIEDERFHEHVGFDIKAIGRAFITNLRQQRTAQGGSTITQQLVKNAFLTPDRDYKRKVQEVYLAYQLERQFHKDEILELYLNWIYFDYSTNGVEAAAQMLFDKSISEVTLAEAALMAGIPNNPGMYSPYRNMDGAKSRQSLILNKMLELEMISESEYEQALNEKFEDFIPPSRTAPYFCFYEYVVHTELKKILPEIPELADYNTYLAALYSGGLHIYTTLDTELQEFAEEVVNNPDNYPTTVEDDMGKKNPQANVVLSEPETGLIRVLVGGREQGTHNQVLLFDRGRDTGSAIKPIITYAPALEEGVITTATPIDDSPIELQATDGMFRPENVDNHFRGLVGMRESLAHSHNIPALRVFQELGVSKGIEYAKRFGLEGLVDPPGIDGKHDHGVGATLGGLTNGVTTLEMVQAFSVLANQGMKLNMTTVTRIEDSSGKVIYEHKPEGEKIVSPETAYIITDMLIDTVRWGSGSNLRLSNQTMAAKTGTSDDQRTGYTVAYTRHYVMGYWIGYEIPRDGIVERSWSYHPGFINPIMGKAHEGLERSNFVRPSNVASASICQKSGLRPGENCPEEDIKTELFVRGTAPTEECDIHVTLLVCSESGLLPSEFCPEDSLEERVFLNRPEYIETTRAWRGRSGRKPTDAEQMPPTEEEICDIHTERPEPPRNLSFKLENGSVTLQWASPEDDIESYLVFRQLEGDEAFVRLTENPIQALSYVDNQVEIEKAYIYSVVSINEQGTFSDGATITVETKKVEEYTLTVNTSPSEGGTVTGGGSYSANSHVDIKATPASGWRFVEWQGDGINNRDNAEAKVTLNDNKTIRAIFERGDPSEITEYTLTIQIDGEGSVDPAGGGSYPVGSTVDIKATPAPGWEFVEWEGDGINPKNKTEARVKIDGNTTITAVFVEIEEEEENNGD